MESRKLFVTFLISLLLNAVAPLGAEDFKRDDKRGARHAYFVRNPLQRLNSTILDSFMVSEPMGCVFQCITHQECYSVNFASVSHEGKHMCELLNADMFRNSTNFLQSISFDHYSIKSPCMSNPCQDGALFCRPIYQQDDYQCVCKPGFTGNYCETVPVLDIHVRSEGCDDPGIVDGCGKAYIKVDGTDYSLQRRGHNVVVVDGETGVLLAARAYDTHGSSSSGYNLRNYLNSLSGNKIVLVATQDSAAAYMSPAIDALKRLGATDPLQANLRDSFAFAGYAGVNKPQWITQKRADRYQGPSEIFPQIPMSA